MIAAAVEAPSPADVEAAKERISTHLLETPVIDWPGVELPSLLGHGTQVVAKLELFQRTGSFKPRGALNVAMSLPSDAVRRGFTAVSAGNHAIAVAFAARALGTTAKVVMHKNANPYRVGRCRALGAEIVLANDMGEAFQRVAEIRDGEGRSFIHPFEGPKTFEGTGTLALELLRQAGQLDAIIVPIGGGGLIAGIAAYVKQVSPNTLVFGVEPEGASGMAQSLAAGHALDKVAFVTIADSLAPPMHLPLSYALVARFVDGSVTVSDDAMRAAMGLMLRDLKLAVEPAPAAGVAALIGPLRERLAGKRVGLVVCGANIDEATFTRLIAAPAELRS